MQDAEGMTRFTASEMAPDIVVVEWQPRIRFDDRDAADIIGHMRRLGTDGPRQLLVRPAGMTSISWGALRAFTQPGWVSRMAVTGRSLIDSFLLDIYIELYKPPYEVRHFDSEPAALWWLRSPLPHEATGDTQR